jgi:phosphatidylinositol alpha-1,6-mannosyltransferase
LKLLIFSTEFPPGPGGIGTHAHQLALQLEKSGWEVCVLTSQDYASREEIEKFNSVQPFRIDTLRVVPHILMRVTEPWREASRLIREFRPDLLVATGSRSVWISALLAKKYRLKWIAIGHGGEFRLRKFWRRKFTKWSFQAASSVVCVSRFTWQQMLDSGVKPAKGKVILNGADSDQFRILPEAEVEEFKRNFGLNGVRVILTVGNVSRRKGQDLVIKALPRILKEIPNAHYFMAGLPTIQKELQKLADTCEVNDHVHFLGKQDPWMLVRLLNSSDIFVLTSRHTNDGDFEGFGIAVLEAALCGKPAVVSAGAGLEEAIEDGISGILVQSENE